MNGTAQTKQSKRRRLYVRWLLPALALLFAASLLAFAWPHIQAARTIGSLRKVDDYPLYTMTYFGGYDLDYSAYNPSLAVAGGDMLCSSFLARNEKGEPLFCRNLDYTLTSHPIVMVSTGAPGKNAGLAICDLFYLGYRGGKLPTGSVSSDGALLMAPRITIDGMNEHGVALAILSVPHAEPALDPARQTIDEVAAVRLSLDSAKTVDEAVEVIKGYNMVFNEGPVHFMIADGSGDSAIVELMDGETKAIRSGKAWQVATNFIVSSPAREGVGQDRYDLAEQALEKAGGVLGEEEAMDLLGRVSQPGTLWSVIYNLRTGEARLALKKNFDKIYQFKLKMHDPV